MQARVLASVGVESRHAIRGANRIPSAWYPFPREYHDRVSVVVTTLRDFRPGAFFRRAFHSDSNVLRLTVFAA